jgi:hypothetical protein
MFFQFDPLPQKEKPFFLAQFFLFHLFWQKQKIGGEIG